MRNVSQVVQEIKRKANRHKKMRKTQERLAICMSWLCSHLLDGKTRNSERIDHGEQAGAEFRARAGGVLFVFELARPGKDLGEEFVAPAAVAS